MNNRIRLIDANKLIKKINLDIKKSLKNRDYGLMSGLIQAEYYIEIAKTINCTPIVHGHWSPVETPTGVSAFGTDEMTVNELKCSECGMTIDVSEGNFKYCPYCSSENLKESE